MSTSNSSGLSNTSPVLKNSLRASQSSIKFWYFNSTMFLQTHACKFLLILFKMANLQWTFFRGQSVQAFEWKLAWFDLIFTRFNITSSHLKDVVKCCWLRVGPFY